MTWWDSPTFPCLSREQQWGQQWQQCIYPQSAHHVQEPRDTQGLCPCTEGLLLQDVDDPVKKWKLLAQIFHRIKMQEIPCFCGFQQIGNKQLRTWRQTAVMNTLCNKLRSAELSDLTQQTQIFPQTHAHTQSWFHCFWGHFTDQPFFCDILRPKLV